MSHAVVDKCASEIFFAESEEQIRACYPVMRELRPHLDDEQQFIAQVKRQIGKGYHLACLAETGEIKAVTGFRFLEFLAWGRVLYIDDLVSDARARKKGYGSKLLQWVIQRARDVSCDQVHLDSGPQRYDAHRLYLNHGFKIIGHHFALDFKTIEEKAELSPSPAKV